MIFPDATRLRPRSVQEQPFSYDGEPRWDLWETAWQMAGTSVLIAFAQVAS